jgi:hypothetical protein
MANNAELVRVGSAGKVFHAPLATVLPTDTTTALNVAFLDVGYISDEGVTADPEESTADFRAWGGDLVRRVISEYGETYTFTMIERNDNSASVYYGTGATASAWEGKLAVIRRSWVLHITDGAHIERIVLPDAQVTDRGAITYATTEVIGFPITVSTYPNAAGVHSFGYATAPA